MSQPVPPSSEQPHARPAVGEAMFAGGESRPPHGFKARLKRTWRPLLLGFGVGVVVLGAAAGGTGYVWHQNNIEEDRATAKEFASEKAAAVESAREEGVTQGTQDGYAKYKAEAERQAAAAKAEAEKPYTEAKLALELAEPMCVKTKADKKAITFTDHSVTVTGIGVSAGPSDKAAGCVLGSLGMDSAVLDKMGQTRALDGRQEDSWGVWDISWTYHPDNGLDLIAEIQDAPAN